MKKLSILFLAILLGSSLAFADVKISGELESWYRGPNNNHSTSGAFYLANTYLQVQTDINEKTELTAKGYFNLNDTELYFEEYYLKYKTEIQNLSLIVGMQEIFLGRYYKYLLASSYFEFYYKQYDFGVVGEYNFNKINILAGIFNSSAYWTGSPDNKVSYAIQTSYDLAPMLPNIDFWEIGAGYLKDPGSAVVISLFSQVKAYDITADVEYGAQNNVTHGSATTNDSFLRVGGVYQVFSDLEIAANYDYVKYNSLNPKIISVGANYNLAKNLTLTTEVVLPQYDGLNSYSDNNYYIIGLKAAF
ncbi:hypothetical protein HN928_03025 [bacterium]|nr:hypothetical protein [bacterium]